MASNSFGNVFRVTTWGESHGPAIGAIIDGCPAGVEIDALEINAELALRAPGKSDYTSARKENDQIQILSGVFEGKTTGAPICLLILNQDANSSHYGPIKDLLRPGHANFTYLEKYGIYDHQGGGRASARETTARVAAGAIAKKFLAFFNIEVAAYIKQIGPIISHPKYDSVLQLKNMTYQNPVHCPDSDAAHEMVVLLDQVKAEGDSLGGIIEFIAINLPTGLGDPVYEKLEAKLAHAMMSLPACKGFEIGNGFACVTLKGSENNDLFIHEQERVKTSTNYSGGTLGGISNGMPITGRVAFKPTSSIRKAQQTLNLNKETETLQLPSGSRHDPCVAIRAVVIVEAMLALVLTDALLLNRCAKL